MAALFVIGVPVAWATAIEIPIDTVVKAEEGSITVLATTDAPPDLIGTSCVGVAEAINQSSAHNGNDLIVTSGDDSILLEDVEREPGAITTAEALLTLGPTVTVTLRMGPDEVFSAGLLFTIDECTPPSTTTTTQAPSPAIVIEKLADPEFYDDLIGHFTIRVTNPGPVDLTNVNVTDEIAIAIDPGSDCPNPEIPDLAVGEFHEYDCMVANLDGVSLFRNEATAIGTGPDGTEVTDTDDATVYPIIPATTITRPPQTTTPPPPTLPNTGVPYEKVRGVGMAGIVFIVGGVALLNAAALIGRLRPNLSGIPAVGHGASWLTIEIKPRGNTIYISLRPAGSDTGFRTTQP